MKNISAQAPLVSVIMPFYNTAQFISSAVQSIQAQTYENWELIAVDDASTDDSRAVIGAISDPRITVLVMEANSGQGACYNLGLQNIKGEFIALMDSDDISPPNRLEICLEYLERNPTVLMVGSSRMKVFNNESEIAPIQKALRPSFVFEDAVHRFKATMLLFNSIYLQPTVLARRSLWGDLRYGTSRFAEDYELFTRAVDRGKLGDIPTELGYYRMHPGQTTQRLTGKTELIIQNVWRPLLERWGLQPTENELTMHSVLSLAWRPLEKSEIEAFMAWISKLETHFQDHPVVDCRILKQFIIGKVFDVFRDSAYLGFPLFVEFERYRRRSKQKFALSKRIKFALKVVLEHVRS